jgi:rhodanese-related sulfurtransferase
LVTRVKRQYSSKRNLCIFCGNHHGCSTRDDGLFECLRCLSQKDAPAGYRFLGLLRNNMGGLFAKDDNNDDQKFSSLYSQRQHRSISDKAYRRLSIEERDRHFRLILEKTALHLSPQHCLHLEQTRQLNASEIAWLKELGWVRTWENDVYAPLGITADLPGISPSGKILGRDGIAIAALDPDFHITGFQIATLQTNPKYIWLSGNNQGGNGPQLPNGELPLFCWKHPDTKKAKVAILCEGALKSLLVAMFLWRQGQTDVVVIGTASAAYYGEKTLKDYLKQLHVKEIRLMPDAGAITNPHITKANQTTVYFCQKWRYRVTVGSWEQWHTKEQLDIDEMLAAGRQNEIRLMTAGVFLSQCHQALQIAKSLKLGCFHQIADKQIELHPQPDAINDWQKIHLYYQNIQTLRKGNCDVMVAWENSLIRPEDFFALCSETIQQRLAQSEREWGMLYKLKLWVRRMLERYRPKKGFGLVQIEETSNGNNESKKTKIVTTSDTIKYKAGKLPRIGECEHLPKILFKKGQRSQVIKETILAGWQHILDKSPTGTFKSYDAGLAAPEAFGVKQLWYFTSHARNITTQSVENNYTYLDVRNDGMVWESTPAGKKYLRWPRKEEIPDTSGNCYRSKIFAVLRDKNISDINGQDNPVCGSCRKRLDCPSNSGVGFGYKFLRQEALKCQRIRSHPDSAPEISDYNWSRVGNFWDEVMQTVQPMTSVAAHLVDIDRVIAELAVYHPEVNARLTNLWMVLRRCLNGEIKQPFYGWNDAAVRELLPEPPDNLKEIITASMEFLHPNLDELFHITNEHSVKLSDLPSRMGKRMGNNNSEVADTIQQNIILNWFVPFLQVWGKQVNGALRIEQGKLFIYTRNQRHSQIAKASAWNVYLDATTTPEYLSWWMDIDSCEILTIEQEITDSKNLEVIQITGLGQLGKERSPLSVSRVAALRQELQVRHPDIKFIEWKCQRSSQDGAWFVDSRGSNDFCGVSTLASIGIPYFNLGYLEALYITLTGQSIEPGTTKVKILVEANNSDDGLLSDDYIESCFERTASIDDNFQAFVDWSTSSEIYQALGRLRSHLRPSEKLTFYFIGDYPIEIPVKFVKACDITIEAGSRWEQTWFKIASAAKQLIEEGVTEVRGIKTAISHKVGCSVGLISKDYKVALDKLLQSLLNTSNRTCKNSQVENYDEAKADSIASSVMRISLKTNPSEVIQEFLLWQRCLDKNYWLSILLCTPIETQIKIISGLLSILPKAWVCEFIETVVSLI